MNWRERELVAEFNPRRHLPLADDKIVAKKLMASRGVPIPGTIAVIENMRDLSGFERLMPSLDHFVIKPARGKAGSGVAVLGPRAGDGWHCSSGTTWEGDGIRLLLADILSGEYAMRTRDRALIEERIFSGPILGDLPPAGLPDVRVITLHGDPVMSMVRLPTRQSGGKANLHLGALGIGVDQRTGSTTGATCRGRAVSHHPETGQPLAGLKVTAWDDVIATAREAAAAFPLGYLGVDVSIDHACRPVVLEVNPRPGLEIQNANLRGLRFEIERVIVEQAARARVDDRAAGPERAGGA